MIACAYKTVTDNNAWYVFDIPIHEDRGYMFCKDARVIELMNKIDTDYNGCHSGSSIGFTMRILQHMYKTKDK